MVWSSRIFYPAAMVLASMPPLLVGQVAHLGSTPVVVSDAMGLTLGEDARGHVVVTSLRSGGSANHNGISVGDRLDRMAGRPVAGLATVRRLIRAPHCCAIILGLQHDGMSYDSKVWQCAPTVDTVGQRAGAGKTGDR